MKSKSKSNRIKMVRAMELLARAVNDEDVFCRWLLCGVADGDIGENTTDEELEFYTDDKTFSELMGVFLRVMAGAYRSGGLYFDKILSKEEHKTL